MSVQVIGAGLAGLAAACRLAEAGQHVVLHEAAKFAGGRARSYDDPVLGCRIDNGNHLLLSGNGAAMAAVCRWRSFAAAGFGLCVVAWARTCFGRARRATGPALGSTGTLCITTSGFGVPKASRGP